MAAILSFNFLGRYPQGLRGPPTPTADLEALSGNTALKDFV
jgi:hypothetical protein